MLEILPQFLSFCSCSERSPAKAETPSGFNQTRPSPISIWEKMSVGGNFCCRLCVVSSSSCANAARLKRTLVRVSQPAILVGHSYGGSGDNGGWYGSSRCRSHLTFATSSAWESRPCWEAMTSKRWKPSIVFVHGLWADGSCFSKLIPTLQTELCWHENTPRNWNWTDAQASSSRRLH